MTVIRAYFSNTNDIVRYRRLGDRYAVVLRDNIMQVGSNWANVSIRSTPKPDGDGEHVIEPDDEIKDIFNRLDLII